MRIDELLSDPSADLTSPIALAAQGDFRWGRAQAILYDPRREDIFPQPYLYRLYERARLSGQRRPAPFDLDARRGLGSLPSLFCGMQNLGPDAICAYLSQRPVCVVGEWRCRPKTIDFHSGETLREADPPDAPSEFHPLGFCFPSTPVVVSSVSSLALPSNSVFAGYTIFSEAWRTPAQTVLMFLGLAWLFHRFQLAHLHGSRYPTNHLTARFTRRFGFRDCGEMPGMMTPAEGVGELVPAVFSTLSREEFEARLRAVLVAARSAVPSLRPSVPSPTAPPSVPPRA